MTRPGTLPPVPKSDLEHVLEVTRSLWDRIRGERVFVTGGTGFVGTWLLEALAFANDRLATGIRATVLTRDPESFAGRSPHLARRDDLTLHRGDVRSFPFPTGGFCFVVHGATDSRASVQDAARADLASTIVNGTARVLEMADAAGARNVLFISSGAVYGPQPARVAHVPETHCGAPDPLDVRSTYGESKRMAEHLCRLATSDRHGVRIARLFAFVGPLLPLDANFAVGNFLRDASAGGPITVQGDGTPRRSYLHAADLVAWLLKIMIDGRPAWPYNVGSDEVVSIGDLATKIARLVGDDVEVQVARSPQPGGPSRYVPDIHRAREELGLDVWIDLDESLRRTLDWVRSLH